MPLASPNADYGQDQAEVLVQTARDFAREELLPLDRAWDTDESSVAEALPRLSQMGFLGLVIPEQFGGLACTYRTYAAILHELSVSSPAACVTVGVHNLAGGIVDRFAEEPRRTQWLSKWTDPSSFGAFALSEADAGSDARRIKTTARKTNDGYVLNGEKMWVTNGLSAGWYLTLTRLQGMPTDKNYTAFMVDGRSNGLTRTKIKGKMGIRGSETAVVHFHDVLVPHERLIGEPGKGLTVFLSSLNRGRIGIAAQATGIAEACLNEMVSYARQREQFGRPIGAFQAVADMIATSAVELEAAKLLTWRAATCVDRGLTERTAGSMAKLYASEAANRIAYRAVQVHGGAGFVHECRVEQLYRDARITTIYEGTSEIQRIVIARELRGASRRPTRRPRRERRPRSVALGDAQGCG